MTQFELLAFVALVEMNFLASRSNYPSYGAISVDFDDPIITFKDHKSIT